MIALWLSLGAVWVTCFGFLLHKALEVKSLGWLDTTAVILAVALWPLVLLAHGACSLFLEDK